MNRIGETDKKTSLYVTSIVNVESKIIRVHTTSDNFYRMKNVLDKYLRIM